VIRFDDVSFTYAGATEPALAGVDLRIDEGELCLVVGATGSGKTTLLQAVNGLVPHFTGGTLSGVVTVDGRDTRTHPPRELADVVGFVGQNPGASFVTTSVEDELVYTMESLGRPRRAIRRQLEDALDLLSLADLRHRDPSELSGGQQQRVAIGAVLAANPSALVLDEPTSALDPLSAEDVLASLTRLVDDLGITVVVAEHRLERVLGHADRMIWLPGDARSPVSGTVAEVMRVCPLRPPVVQLAGHAGWTPPTLTVRDARTRATALRAEVRDRSPSMRTGRTPGAAVVSVDGLVVLRGDRRAPVTALALVDLEVHAGTITAVMGRNGSGKSSLLGALAGAHEPSLGRISYPDADLPAARPSRWSRRRDRTDDAPHRWSPRELVRRVGLVPQNPADLLYLSSVAAECTAADADTGSQPGRCRALLDELVGGLPPERHPRDLSEGQRLALALAIVLTGDPPLLLCDEPTRGLDYPSKHRLVRMLADQAAAGRAVVVASHDVELVAELADAVVLLANGQVVDRGPTAQVLTASPTFAPQMAKVFRPTPLLTVDDVGAVLGWPGELGWPGNLG
jgi:energy-coupling factor transport system ATP-binding protein